MTKIFPVTIQRTDVDAPCPSSFLFGCDDVMFEEARRVIREANTANGRERYQIWQMNPATYRGGWVDRIMGLYVKDGVLVLKFERKSRLTDELKSDTTKI